MNYIMKAGALYINEALLARIKGNFTGPEKKIFSADGALLLSTDININDMTTEKTEDIHLRRYIMMAHNEVQLAYAKPGYAKEGNHEAVDWSIYNVQRVDHANVFIKGTEYYLMMINNQNYRLSDMSGNVIVQIIHKGLNGGWNIETDVSFPPEIICGIFVFCRYIERENEFLVV